MIAEKEISIWSRALLRIMENNGQKKSELALEKLSEILKKKKKGYLLPKIVRRVKVLCSKRHGVKIFLAKDHPDDFIEKITGKMLPALSVVKGSGSKKPPENVEVCVDPGLIGGFRVKTGNFLIKGSIKDFLSELKSRLTG